jgi:4-alpha-glucanotransferase
MNPMNTRACGILMHISSLPSAYGIGDLGPSAYAFVDFLKNAGQRYWQILPINPTDGINGHSPYSCFSAFAGNPLFISPDQLVSEGGISSKALKNLPTFDERSVDYAAVSVYKEKFLSLAFEQFQKRKDRKDYEDFCLEHAGWLNDFALFTVIKSSLRGQCWSEWPSALKKRNPHALSKFAKNNPRDLERTKFIQYLFFKQWHALKEYANSKGVQIIGDIPIYVNYDSVEVWCYPQYFKLTPSGELRFVSGCPPDYFSKTGQRWGNPVYDWAVLKKSKYDWWVKRIQHDLSLFDFLRIDHFRGFLSYWQIPAHEKLAVFGRWVKGPGDNFFKVLTRDFKSLPLIAEDLGEITPDVPKLMQKFDIPGMRVLLFGFGGDPRTNPHMPANYVKTCVAYTGTHDNNTIKGWYNHEANPQEKANVRAFLGKSVSLRTINWAMIDKLLQSRANTIVLSMPDVLELDEEGRMNTPATKVHNWKWRVPQKAMKPALAAKLKKEMKLSKR